MKLINNGFFLFDMGFPIHTWYPILDGKLVTNNYKNNDIYNDIEISDIKNRALYFHIPFCEKDICSFCSFPRKLKSSDNEVNKYVDALVKEIELKAKYSNVTSIPINAIFFFLLTPSILTPKQIELIGNTIKKYFDLSNLKEFSFENNIGSITEEKLKSLKNIGVTHIRAGVQSLNKKYRDYFNLHPSINDVYEKVDMMKKYFENTSIDMIYGINGQTIDEFIEDIHLACKLNTKLIDFYPLTQPAANTKLNNLFSQNGLLPKTELEIIGFGMILKQVTKNYGYISHNGHGFVKVSNSYISNNENYDNYSFHYHKCTMGYDDGDVIGFGAGASSRYINYGICNENNIDKYISSIENNIIPCSIYSIDKALHYSKGITTHLPYFGYAEKSKIDFDKVSNETIKRLKNLVDNNIVYEKNNIYYLREDAWYWDNVLMYYLSPECERNVLDNIVNSSKAKQIYKFDYLNIGE